MPIPGNSSINRCAVFALALLSAAAFGASPPAKIESKEALSGFFRSTDGSRSLEVTPEAVKICSDGCQIYASKRGFAEAEVWDLILLHEYYFIGKGPVTEFREKYAPLAQSLLSKYDMWCPRAAESARLGCIISYMGMRNEVRFANVFEKNGQHCEVWTHLVHSKTIYRSSCQ